MKFGGYGGKARTKTETARTPGPTGIRETHDALKHSTQNTTAAIQCTARNAGPRAGSK
jgi:hypothetical protein